MDVVLNNIPVEKPDMISADTIYRTIIKNIIKINDIKPILVRKKYYKILI